MNFFFPATECPERAEYLWDTARMKLEHDGYPSEPRRIHALYFERDFERRVYQVGMEDGDTGDLILLILRAANAPFYWVCTPMNGMLEGAPIPVPVAGTRAVSFGRKQGEPRRPGAGKPKRAEPK